MKTYLCFSRGFHFISEEALYADDGLTFTVIAQNTVMFVYVNSMSTLHIQFIKTMTLVLLKQ